MVSEKMWSTQASAQIDAINVMLVTAPAYAIYHWGVLENGPSAKPVTLAAYRRRSLEALCV